jgi:hypothetical protein
MQRQNHHTTAIKPVRANRVGRAVLLTLSIVSVGIILLWGRSPVIPIGSPPSAALPAQVVVAPTDPQQTAALVGQHIALRARLGPTVAPVDPQQIAALVGQQAALRARLGLTVAPVDPQQIAALMQS